MSVQSPRAVYASNGWEIDLARRELRSQGVSVPIGSRAFEILEVLVRSGGELVSKYHLMEQVWPGAIVEENTLQFHISAIRKALGADRGLLKTVSGRGYRLLGLGRRTASDRAEASRRSRGTQAKAAISDQCAARGIGPDRPKCVTAASAGCPIRLSCRHA